MQFFMISIATMYNLYKEVSSLRRKMQFLKSASKVGPREQIASALFLSRYWYSQGFRGAPKVIQQLLGSNPSAEGGRIGDIDGSETRNYV
jgi:hypothetical protein